MRNTSEFERKHPILAVLLFSLAPEVMFYFVVLLFAVIVWVARAGYGFIFVYILIGLIFIIRILSPVILAFFAKRNDPEHGSQSETREH